MTSNGEHCPAGQSITSEAVCRSAAAKLCKTFTPSCPTKNVAGTCVVVPTQGPYPVSVCDNGQNVVHYTNKHYVCTGRASGGWGVGMAYKSDGTGYSVGATSPETATRNRVFGPGGYTGYFGCSSCIVAPGAPHSSCSLYADDGRGTVYFNGGDASATPTASYASLCVAEGILPTRLPSNWPVWVDLYASTSSSVCQYE